MIAPTPLRTPTAYLLLGMIAGLILARHFTVQLHWSLLLALAVSLIALLMVFSDRSRKFWLSVFMLGSTLCFWTYGQMRLPSIPCPEDLALPEREAKLTLEITMVMGSVGNYNNYRGIARVLSAPQPGRIRPGDLLYLRIWLPHTNQTSEQLTFLFQRGLRIRATGILRPVQTIKMTTNDRDFCAYLKSLGVHYQFDRIHEIQSVRAPPAFTQLCVALNERLQQTLRLGAPENTDLENIYVTMLSGCKAELSREQSERYRTTGTMHFFAISGLHIGVIAAVIAQCLTLMRVPYKWSPLIGLPLLYLYVEVTGASPSAVRAFMMASFFWSSVIVSRQHNSFSALVNSAVAVLLLDPNQLWSIGFQLSYTVVGSILLFGLPLHCFLQQRIRLYCWLPETSLSRSQKGTFWIFNKTLQLFSISFSAWLVSMPLSADFFNFITPGGIVLNMLLVYLVAIIIISGVLSLGCAVLLLSPVSQFINHSAWLIACIMDNIVIGSTYIPFMTFPINELPDGFSYLTLSLYFIALLWLQRRPEKIRTHYIGLPVVIILCSLGAGIFTQ